MPALQLYLHDNDKPDLLQFINEQRELAPLVRGEEYDWIAQSVRPALDFSTIWHVPSGPIPVTDQVLKNVRWIDNPFMGWNDRTGRNIFNQSSKTAGLRMPFHPGIFHLDLCTLKDGVVGMSHIQWLGNHYSVSGVIAKPATERYWSRMKRAIGKIAPTIPRSNRENAKKEVYCFRHARQHIESGGKRASNPWFWDPI